MSNPFPTIAAVFISLMLLACQPGSTVAPTGSVSMLNDTMQIGLPRGYCIDKNASKDNGTTAVAFLGRCASTAKTQPALISIAIGAPGSAGVMLASGQDLSAFFTSNVGRKTLSRNSRARDVRVISASGSDNLLRLRLFDAPIGEYWRGITAIRGRLVTISTIGSREQPLDPIEGRKLLDATLSRMQAVNRQAP